MKIKDILGKDFSELNQDEIEALENVMERIAQAETPLTKNTKLPPINIDIELPIGGHQIKKTQSSTGNQPMKINDPNNLLGIDDKQNQQNNSNGQRSQNQTDQTGQTGQTGQGNQSSSQQNSQQNNQGNQGGQNSQGNQTGQDGQDGQNKQNGENNQDGENSQDGENDNQNNHWPDKPKKPKRMPWDDPDIGQKLPDQDQDSESNQDGKDGQDGDGQNKNNKNSQANNNKNKKDGQKSPNNKNNGDKNSNDGSNTNDNEEDFDDTEKNNSNKDDKKHHRNPHDKQDLRGLQDLIDNMSDYFGSQTEAERTLNREMERQRVSKAVQDFFSKYQIDIEEDFDKNYIINKSLIEDNKPQRKVSKSIATAITDKMNELNSYSTAELNELSEDDFIQKINDIIDLISEADTDNASIEVVDDIDEKIKDIQASLTDMSDIEEEEATKRQKEILKDQAAKARREREKQRAIKTKAAAEAELQKYLGLDGLDRFDMDFYYAIKDQVEKAEETDNSWSALNRHHQDDDIIAPGTKVEDKFTGEIPSVSIYVDCSGSWDANDRAIGRRALKNIMEFVDRGEIQVQIKYFSNYLSDHEQYGGGTDAWPDIIKDIKMTQTKNVVLITDTDMWSDAANSTPISVEGCVWFIWKGSEGGYNNYQRKKLNYIKNALIGESGTYEYGFVS